MKKTHVCLMMAVLLGLTGCDSILGEDKTPEFLRYQLTGEDGTPVDLVISTFFNTGLDELGVTQVQLGLADTVSVTLPWDTVIDVRVQRRFFAQLSAPMPDTATARIYADVDGRQLINESRLVTAEDPFRFLYQFNQAPTTTNIEVF